MQRLQTLFKPAHPGLHNKANYDNLAQQMSQSRVFIIRHAQSLANQAAEEIFDRMPEEGLPLKEFLDLYASPTIVDSMISQFGEEQCEIAGKHASQIDFRIVFVSPLRRTMETAYHIFKSHKNFEQKTMKFILHPDLRELCTVSCDIPLSNDDLRQEIQTKYSPLFNGMLDTSLLEKAMLESESVGKPWYALNCQTIMDVEGPDYTQALSQIVYDQFPKKIETCQEVKARSDKFTNHLQAFLESDEGSQFSQEADGPKVGVVGHSMFFRIYTTQQAYWDEVHDPETNKYPPDNVCHLLMNCEIYPDLKI